MQADDLREGGGDGPKSSALKPGRSSRSHRAFDDHARREARARRKFVAGALEQAGQILGAMSASVLVAGLIGPYIAALAGSPGYSPEAVVATAALALTIALLTAVGAMVLRGLSRRADEDDRLPHAGTTPASAPGKTEPPWT